MNILSLDLEYSQIFHILPSFGITLGKSVYISVHWLNFYLSLKHSAPIIKQSVGALFFRV